MLSDYWALVLTHLVGDFLLQQEHHALNKGTDPRSLLLHCAQYTAPFVLVLWLLDLSLWWALWIYATHLAIDNGWFVAWWSRTFTGSDDAPFWLLVVRDQVFHLLVLAVVVL